MSAKPPETPKRKRVQEEVHVLDIIRSIPFKKRQVTTEEGPSTAKDSTMAGEGSPMANEGSSRDGDVLSKKEQLAEKKKAYYRA